MGVKVSHGLAGISRCQSICERYIGSLMVLVRKLTTASPKATFKSVVQEACYILNKSSHNSLPHGYTPRSLTYFVRASPISYLGVRAINSTPTLGQQMESCRSGAELTILGDIRRGLERTGSRSSVNHTSNIKINSYCMRKKTSFLKNIAKKAQHKVNICVYKVIAKLATNCYKVEDIESKCLSCQAGDNLVVLAMCLEDIMKLLESMREIERTGVPRGARKARFHGLVGMHARDGDENADVIDENANEAVAADRRYTRAMTARNAWVSGEDEVGTARLFQ